MFFRDTAIVFWQSVRMAVISDTHRLINALTERGFSEKQAEAITGAIQQIDLSNVSTKADLKDLENRMLKWMIPLMIGQAAVFGLIVKWLVG